MPTQRLGNERFRLVRWLVLSAVIVMISACSSTDGLAIRAPWVAPSPTVLPTSTATPTLTPSPTATPTMTPTATPSPTPSPTPMPLTFEVELDPPVVVEGGTAAFFIRASRPCQVTVWVDDVQVPMITVDDAAYAGFIGVNALAGETSQSVRISALTEDGQELHFNTMLYTTAGTFESESLTFTPSTEALLAPEIARPEAERMAEIFAMRSPVLLWHEPFAWPRESVITSQFGTRRRYGEVLSSYHAGLDLRGMTGEPVHAPASGVVVLAEELQVRGRAVVLDHGAGVMSGYFHLEEIGVDVGQTVSQGDLLGTVGATGLVTGSHLHWEMRVGGVAVNPVEWLGRVFPWASFPEDGE